jgi:hypothetical protein
MRRLMLANAALGIATMLLRLELAWVLAAPFGKTNLLAAALLMGTLLTYPLATAAANVLTTHSALVLVRWSHVAVVACGLMLTVLPPGVWTLVTYFLCNLGLLLLYIPQNAALFCWGQRTIQHESLAKFAANWELQVQLSAVAGSLASMLLSGVGLSHHGPWLAAVAAGLGLLLLNDVPGDQPSERDRRSGRDDGRGATPQARPTYGFRAIMLIALMPYVIVLIGNFLWPAVLQASLAGPAVYKGQVGAYSAGAALAAAMRRFAGSFSPVVLLGTTFLVFAIAISTVAIAAHLQLAGLFTATFLFVGASTSIVKICRNEMLLRETSVTNGLFVGKLSNHVGAAVQFAALLLGTLAPAFVIQWMPKMLGAASLVMSGALIGLLFRRSRQQKMKSDRNADCVADPRQRDFDHPCQTTWLERRV